MCDSSELEDLLDSALEDFDALPKVNNSAEKKIVTVGNVDDNSSKTNRNTNDLGNFSSLKEELDKIAENSSGNNDSNSRFMAEALEELAKNSENINSLPSEEQMSQMLGGGQGSLDNLLPMMEGMMHSLLSKDLLYPALKDIEGKYPDWLADNRNVLSEEDFSKYNKQYDITKKICLLFEEEKETDSGEVKQKRFEKIMTSMQEMQSLGHPPKEITGENELPGFEMDATGNPLVPGMPGDEQCVIS